MLIDSPIVAECFDLLERRYIEAWRAAKTVDLREEAHRYVMMLEWFRNDLRSIATTGDLTQQRVDELRGNPIKLAEFKR